MNEEFLRRLNAYKEAAVDYGRNPGPRQINWLAQSELNVIAYFNQLQEKKDE